MKATNNNIVSLKASLVAAPTVDSVEKKDAIIAKKDAEIDIKIAKVVVRDAIIGNLNANISQMQLSMNVNTIDKKNFDPIFYSFKNVCRTLILCEDEALLNFTITFKVEEDKNTNTLPLTQN